MKREVLLELGLGEEQVTKVLNEFHNANGNARKTEDELAAVKAENEELRNLKKELENIKNEKLSESEKLEKEKKEVEKNLAESRIILSKAKAKEILSEVNITDEDIIDTVVTDDLAKTVARATALANKIKFVKEDTEKKTKEAISNLDIKPNPSNANLGGGAIVNDAEVTAEKYDSWTTAEKTKFKREHPEEWKKIMSK